MIFKSKKIQGKELIIRSVKTEDAEDLIKFLKITASETNYLIRDTDEINITLKDEEEFIKNNINSKNELMLIAKVNGKLAGTCSVMSFGQFRRYSHRCSLAIALYKQYWRQGIAKALLNNALDEAKKNGYEQAELEVVSENTAAIKLYESLGFERYGTFPDNMKYKNGKYADVYWMMKKL